jgi:hypothetical protein
VLHAGTHTPVCADALVSKHNRLSAQESDEEHGVHMVWQTTTLLHVTSPTWTLRMREVLPRSTPSMYRDEREAFATAGTTVPTRGEVGTVAFVVVVAFVHAYCGVHVWFTSNGSQP